MGLFLEVSGDKSPSIQSFDVQYNPKDEQFPLMQPILTINMSKCIVLYEALKVVEYGLEIYMEYGIGNLHGFSRSGFIPLTKVADCEPKTTLVIVIMNRG